MLAGIASLAGCFESQLVYCDNGAICPVSFACTERTPTVCGEPENVAPCKTADDRTGCSTALVAVGTCVSGVCSECNPNFLECRYPDWRAMASNTDKSLYALWAPAEDNVYAVGESSTVMHYNGTEWAPMMAPGGTPATLVGVWGSGSELFVIANDGRAFHYTTSWTEIPPLLDSVSNPIALLGIWGSDASNVIAVGGAGTIARLAGAAWQPIPSNVTSGLRAIAGTSATDIYAVGNAGVIQHYNGSNWQASPNTPLAGLIFNAVWTSTAGDVVAVGLQSTSAIVVSKAAAGWNRQLVTTTQLNGVWGSSDTDIYTVGTAGTVMHWTGSQWEAMDSASGKDLTAVAGVASSVFAVGATGTILRYTH